MADVATAPVAKKSVSTKPYKLKPGHTFYQIDDEGKPVPVKDGATVLLTESQAKAFADKFAPIEGVGLSAENAEQLTALREAELKQQAK